MKILLQKVSLLVIGVVASIAVSAQAIEVSVMVAGSKQILANGGAPLDVSAYGDAVQNFFPLDVTIKNTGSADLILNISGGKYVSLSGTGASDYTVTESSITSATIPANGTQVFSVDLSPGATNGTKTVTLNLSTNIGAYAGSIKYSYTNLTTSLTKASDIGLSLYPNPSNDGRMHVSANNVTVDRIVVSNVAGQTEEFATTEFKTSLKGLLLVRLYTDKGVVSEKIIVQE